MQNIMRTVYQLEEAKKLILKNDVYSLRMAFVLLDNAIEILMYRRIKSDLAFNDVWLRHDEEFKTRLKPNDYKNWRSNFKLPIIERKRVGLIYRYYDEKVKFLCEDNRRIKKTEASALRSLHKYRNEIYHRDSIRRETIQASTIILFELACNLFPRLHHGTIGYSSEKHDEMERKNFFELYRNAGNNHNHLKDNGLILLKKSLKKDISLSYNKLRNVLQNTLKERITDVLEGLDFIGRDGFGIKTRPTTLKLVQLINSGKLVGPVDYKKYLRKFKAKFTMKDFTVWRKKMRDLNKVTNQVTLFKSFSEIELEFEKLETMVLQAASDLDQAIQHEIDIRRGK